MAKQKPELVPLTVHMEGGPKPFIAWDGEYLNGVGYCILGNSHGDHIAGHEIGTREALELLLSGSESNPGAYHISYSFDYDINHILKDIGWPRLIVLNRQGHVRWDDFEIRHIPKKQFHVRRLSDGASIRIDDIFMFFQSGLPDACDMYLASHGDERLLVREWKRSRPHFTAEHEEAVLGYWRTELGLMVALADTVRESLLSAGFVLDRWHGPGALSASLYRRHSVKDHRAETPEDMQLPARTAYSAGWFERFKMGIHEGPVYKADLNSAFAAAFRMLPSLRNGRWEYIKNPDPFLASSARFAVFRIRWRTDFNQFLAACQGMPLPLFHRDSHGVLRHPYATDGWYWNPEAELMVGSSAEFLEAWVFHDDGTYPMGWVSDVYARRLELVARGDPAQRIVKAGMAGLWGRSAQVAGWDKGRKQAPRSHQIEWAGWVTSWCRAMVFKQAFSVRHGLISIDTDGILSMEPFSNLSSTMSLGEWKLEQYSGIIYIQNGIYWLRDMNGEWKPPKFRGSPRGTVTDPQVGIQALQWDRPITLQRRSFIGYGLAMHNRRDEWRNWTNYDYTVDLHRSASRYHSRRMCAACKEGLSLVDCLHDLAPIPSREVVSSPAPLPWATGDTTWKMMQHELTEDHM